MRKKITKQYLEGTREMIEVLQDMQDRINEIKIAATSITAAIRDDVKVQTSGKRDRVADSVTAYVSLQERFDRLSNAYVDRTRVINKASKDFPPKERAVIYEYYALGHDMPEIYRKLHVSERTAYRLRQSAIQRLSKIAA